MYTAIGKHCKWPKVQNVSDEGINT